MHPPHPAGFLPPVAQRGGAGRGLQRVLRHGQRAQLLPGQGWVSRGWV